MPVLVRSRTARTGPLDHRAQRELEQLGRASPAPFATTASLRAGIVALRRLRQHQDQPIDLVPVRRRPPHAGQDRRRTSWCACAATSSIATSGSAPTRRPRASRATRGLFAIASARVGWNVIRNLNLARLGELRGDRPERHTIEGLPATQDVYPDAPGLDGAALRPRGAGAPLRHARARRLHADRLRDRAVGEPGPGHRRGRRRSARSPGRRACWCRSSKFLQGAARVLLAQRHRRRDVPFYDQASLGGELLFRGFQEDRFIDMGAWEVEAEQRITLFQTHIFGVVRRLANRSVHRGRAGLRHDRAVLARPGRGRPGPAHVGEARTSSAASTSHTRARASGPTSCSAIRTERAWRARRHRTSSTGRRGGGRRVARVAGDFRAPARSGSCWRAAACRCCWRRCIDRPARAQRGELARAAARPPRGRRSDGCCGCAGSASR